jgi:tripartite motif-containing protein 71
MNAFTKQHALVGLGKITPIGSITSNSNSTMHSVNIHSTNEPQCESHSEPLRFLCETCKKIVCQECTLKDHKDHDQTPISNITSEKAKEKLKAIHESSKLGIKFIKNSIDRAVTYSQSIERDSLDISSKVKKAFRLLILAAEERERILLEQVDKYRQQKVANLGDQMTGLRSALGDKNFKTLIQLYFKWSFYF